MKTWKSKYVTLFLVVALGAGVMSVASCGGAGGGQSANGESVERSSDGESSLEESQQSVLSSSEELEESVENSETSSEENSENEDQDPEASEEPQISVAPEASEPIASEVPESSEVIPDETQTVTDEEWEKAFDISNYAFSIVMLESSEPEYDYAFYTDRDGDKYAVTYEKDKGIEVYIQTLGSIEDYYRYEQSEVTGDWEQILVSGEHNYSEMYFALEMFSKAFRDKYAQFTYDEGQNLYYAEGMVVEGALGSDDAVKRVEIVFTDKHLTTICLQVSQTREMVLEIFDIDKVEVKLPDVKESKKTVTEEEWEDSLKATNYTCLGEMWSASSVSPVLNVKRDNASYYMSSGAEEYIVETGETDVYYRWSDSEKAWQEDGSAPSQQHLIPEQLRAVLSGAYDTFAYNEESKRYEASNVTLTLMGQAMPFDLVTVSFENGKLSQLYCEAGNSGMRFTYSQYGHTMVEFFEKESVGDNVDKPDVNVNESNKDNGKPTTDQKEEF